MVLDSILTTQQIKELSVNVDSLSYRLEAMSHTVMEQIIPQKELYEHIINFQMLWFGLIFTFGCAMLGFSYYLSVCRRIRKLKKDLKVYKDDLRNTISKENKNFQSSLLQWMESQRAELSNKIGELLTDEYILQVNINQAFYLNAIEKGNYALAILLLLETIVYTIKSDKKAENSLDDLITLLEKDEVNCNNNITEEIHEDIDKEFYFLLSTDIPTDQKNRLRKIRESIHSKYYIGISNKVANN